VPKKFHHIFGEKRVDNMDWKNIIRKSPIKGHDDYKMYFSFFDGETVPFGSVVEYTGSKSMKLPVLPHTESMSRQARLEKGNQYKIDGATHQSVFGDYGLVAEHDKDGTVMLPRRTMLELQGDFKVISRGSEQQDNMSVPLKNS